MQNKIFNKKISAKVCFPKSIRISYMSRRICYEKNLLSFHTHVLKVLEVTKNITTCMQRVASDLNSTRQSVKPTDAPRSRCPRDQAKIDKVYYVVLQNVCEVRTRRQNHISWQEIYLYIQCSLFRTELWTTSPLQQ